MTINYKELKAGLEESGKVQLRFMDKDLQEKIFHVTEFLDHRNPTNSERMYCIRNGIYQVPKCPMCHIEVKYNTKNTRYNMYCSSKCANSSPEKLKKAKETNLIKYGVENPMQNEEIKEKSVRNNDYKQMSKTHKENIFNKYGVNHISEIPGVREKTKETNLIKYGVENPMQNEEIKEKMGKIIAENNFEKVMNNPLLLEKVTPLFTKEEYIGYRDSKEYLYRCNLCNNEFEDWIDSTYKKVPRCPNCFPRSKSVAEQEIYNYVKSILPNSVKIIENDRSVLGDNRELDIYIPSLNLTIEYNGLYWHSEAKLGKKYHLDKLERCNSLGITLIQIFEDEWLYKQEIVENRLAHLLMATQSEKVYARKCKIYEVDSSTKKEFLNSYHLQGNDNSSINLGLYYEDELVSLITFTKPRLSLGQKNSIHDYELSRYVNNSSYRVIGGFGKLFSHFKKNYTWSSIITYADMRWSKGNVYFKNGFSFSHKSEPTYWYFKRSNNKGRRLHRFGFRKQILKKKFPEIYSDNKTEREIMEQANYLRVWDCGNLVFTFNR